MTDRANQQTDPSSNPQGPAESPDVESVNRPRQRGGRLGRDEIDRQRDPACADSAEHLAREGHRNVEGP